MAKSLLSFLLFSQAITALPTEHSFDSLTSKNKFKRCGAVSQFYGQNASDWQNHNTDQWLDSWTSAHGKNISANPNGFAAAFGQWAIGNPDWTCRDDGSASSCDLDLCDNRVLNNLGNDIQNAYYVLEAVNRLHGYFTGLSQAFEVSAIATALSKESWSETFYKPKNNDKTISTLREVLNAVTTVIGIGASFAGLAGGPVAAVGGAMSAVASGASAAGSLQLQSE